jgi:DNA polymerase theta
VLQALAAQHPLPGIILQHRKLHKLKTGFMNSLGAKLAELLQQQCAAACGYAAGYVAAAAAMAPAGPCALLDGDDDSISTSSSSSRLVRIRGSFLQTNTATGRLSMDDPALQTIPRPVDFTLELPPAAAATGYSSVSSSDDHLSAGVVGGGVRLQQVQVNVRACFVATAGWVLLSADYSQIELRLVRHVHVEGQGWLLVQRA